MNIYAFATPLEEFPRGGKIFNSDSIELSEI